MNDTYNADTPGYFHLCSSGEEGHNFIKTRDDYYATFNLIGVCAAEFRDEVAVVSFSIEDTHLHSLLYGTKRDCELFADKYKRTYFRHIVSSRGDSDGVSLNFEVIPITDKDYLMNVGAYTIIQPTKDGRGVMPYDYLFGTGSMYFRSGHHIPIWCVTDRGEIVKPLEIRYLSTKQRHRLLFCKKDSVPDDWLVCQDFLLPENYIRVDIFEAIYRTHNCFRAFCSMSNRQLQEMLTKMAEYRGITMEDFEARQLCERKCQDLFGTADTRRIHSKQRLILAQKLRLEHHLSYRQLSTLVRLPEMEIKSYC